MAKNHRTILKEREKRKRQQKPILSHCAELLWVAHFKDLQLLARLVFGFGTAVKL